MVKRQSNKKLTNLADCGIDKYEAETTTKIHKKKNNKKLSEKQFTGFFLHIKKPERLSNV